MAIIEDYLSYNKDQFKDPIRKSKNQEFDALKNIPCVEVCPESVYISPIFLKASLMVT